MGKYNEEFQKIALLPGQAWVLQDRVFVCISDGQPSLPQTPFWHVRLQVWTPPPQEALQLPKSEQSIISEHSYTAFAFQRNKFIILKLTTHLGTVVHCKLDI